MAVAAMTAQEASGKVERLDEAKETDRDAPDLAEVEAAMPVEMKQTRSRKSEIDPLSEPPDGGLVAWLKVLGCFLLYSNVWGFTLTYGAFQTSYENGLLKDSSPSAITWIGTIQSWFLIVFGILSGPLFDMGYYRIMLIVGNFGVIFGVFMLSLAKTYWQVFLAQGVCMGIGSGFLYIPSMAVIGLSFSKKRALAQGIVMSGIAVGGIAYIIAFDRITAQKDFGWAVRTLGFIALFLSLASYPALVYGTEALTKSRTRRKLFDNSAFKEGTFYLFVVGCFMTFLGYMFPYVYIGTFALNTLGLSSSLALYMLIFATAGSFLGRLSAGITAQFLGPILTWLLCAAMSGVMCFCWIAVRSEAGLIAFSVFWGFISAGLVTLPAAVFPSLCPDPRRLGTRIGMAWALSSFGSLIGAPIAGALLKSDIGPNGLYPFSDYIPAEVFAGCCLLVGAGFIACLWVVRMRTEKSSIFI